MVVVHPVISLEKMPHTTFSNVQPLPPIRGLMYREICQTLVANVNQDLLIPESAADYNEFLELIIYGSAQSNFETKQSYL